MTSEYLTVEQAKKLMYTGKFFKAWFLKRTENKVREMVARTGVKKGVTGKGMAYRPADRDLVVVFDMQKKDFRTINLRGLIGLKIDGKKHVVRPEGILL